MRSVSLSSLFVLCWAVLASAQGGTTVNAVRGRISERMVVGSTTLGDVLRIVGSGTVSSGTGTMNPAVVDSDGDVLEDSFTTVSTAGAHTWSAAGSFTSTLGVTGATTLSSTLAVTGNVTGGSGTLLLASPTRITNTSPALFLHDSDASSSEKYFSLEANGGLLALKKYDDTPSSSNVLFQVDSSALVPDDWRWGSLLGTIRPENNGGSNLGSMTKKYLTLHAWELWVDTLVARNVMATIGGRIVVAPTSELALDVATGDACIRVKHNAFRTNDTLLLQKDGKFEKMLLGTGPIDCRVSGNCGSIADAYDHCSVTRNRDGTGANAWSAGDAVVSEGNVGDGYIDIFSDRSASSEGYVGQVISDGPVAYWRMSESPSGQTVDVMGNVPNAVEAGTPNLGLGSVCGVLGTGSADPCFENRAATGYLTVADDADLRITADLTIEWWMYRQSATPSISDLISRGGAREYHVNVEANGALQFCHGNTSTFECDTTAAGFVPTGGADYDHYAIVRDATSSPKRILFYKNGVLAETHNYTQTVTTSTNPLRIGDNPDVGGRYFDGDIDEVAIYNYQLSADRIGLHYSARFNNSISKFTVGPTLCGNVRTGTGAFDIAERWCMGNLAGTYGYNSVTPVYGSVSGSNSATWISAEATNGFRVMNGTTMKMQFDTSGNGFLAGSLSVTNNITVGQAGAIMSGATAYDTGEGYWLDCNYTTGACDPRFRIGTTTGAGTPQYLRWTGSALELKSDRFTISSAGVSIDTAGGLGCASTQGGYYFGFGDAGVNGLYACESSGVRDVVLSSQKSGQAIVEINASNTNLSSTATLQLQADIGATPSFFKVIADDFFINGVQGITATITVPCGLLTFSDGVLTNKGAC